MGHMANFASKALGGEKLRCDEWKGALQLWVNDRGGEDKCRVQ